MGAVSADSNSAELSAMLSAMLTCLQVSDAKCDIFYDSEFAANTASSLWLTSDKSDLAQIAKGTYNTLAVCTQLNLSHEKAHSGLPFNEMADTLRNLYAEVTSSDEGWMWQWHQDPAPVSDWIWSDVRFAQWAFLAVLPAEHRSQYPVVIEGYDMYLSTQECPVASLGLASSARSEIIGGKDRVDAFDSGGLAVDGYNTTLSSGPITCMQVNANTLRSVSKLKNYLKQFRERQVHIAGIEEARPLHTGVPGLPQAVAKRHRDHAGEAAGVGGARCEHHHVGAAPLGACGALGG